ncbi:hypothetical protein RJ639_015002 [Escallonia herrerae]|uniref:Uncharacterized protein n=1 Tax=Escallonia herrerae TaxID=1293975 RepID=A0AA89AM06_9ASTE|nr:hypothetical protein RJ639_015002 [Escallonia herrerae]
MAVISPPRLDCWKPRIKRLMKLKHPSFGINYKQSTEKVRTKARWVHSGKREESLRDIAEGSGPGQNNGSSPPSIKVAVRPGDSQDAFSEEVSTSSISGDPLRELHVERRGGGGIRLNGEGLPLEFPSTLLKQLIFTGTVGAGTEVIWFLGFDARATVDGGGGGGGVGGDIEASETSLSILPLLNVNRFWKTEASGSGGVDGGGCPRSLRFHVRQHQAFPQIHHLCYLSNRSSLKLCSHKKADEVEAFFASHMHPR